MFERLAAGDIKACWIICTNPGCHHGKSEDRHRRAGSRRARHHPGHLPRTTATNRYADIVLPATLWAESDAVMVNSERNLTLLQAVDPTAPGRRGPTGS